MKFGEISVNPKISAVDARVNCKRDTDCIGREGAAPRICRVHAATQIFRVSGSLGVGSPKLERFLRWFLAGLLFVWLLIYRRLRADTSSPQILITTMHIGNYLRNLFISKEIAEYITSMIQLALRFSFSTIELSSSEFVHRFFVNSFPTFVWNRISSRK